MSDPRLPKPAPIPTSPPPKPSDSKPHSDLVYARDLASGYAVPGAIGHVNVLARAVLDLEEQVQSLEQEIELVGGRLANRNTDVARLKEQLEALLVAGWALHESAEHLYDDETMKGPWLPLHEALAAFQKVASSPASEPKS